MPNNKLAPKDRFQSNQQRAGEHQDLVMSPEFKGACEIALAQYAVNLVCDNQMDAMAVGFKLQGAKDFANILLTLGDLKKPPFDPMTEQLRPV